MSIAFVKLPGLPSERIVALVEPVLRAHRVEGVELVWRSDRQGWLLELTIEQPETTVPGMGITVDLCSEISRDLSAALDVADLIGPRYRLEVGSPGVERALYRLDDYRRFKGQQVKLRLKQPFGAPAEPAGGEEQAEASGKPSAVDSPGADSPGADSPGAEGPGAGSPWAGQRVFQGALGGVDDHDCIVLETDQGTLSLQLGSIQSARLVFDWRAAVRGGSPRRPAGGKHKARGVKRSK